MKRKLIAIIPAILLSSAFFLSRAVEVRSQQTEKPVFDSISRYKDEVVENPLGLIGYQTEITRTLQSLVDSLDGSEEVFSTLTFVEPLPGDAVRSLIDQYNLTPTYVISRTMGDDGMVGTSFAIVGSDGEITHPEIVSQLEESGHRYLGIVELVAEVPASRLLALNLDRNVYLVDPSADDSLVQNPSRDYMMGLSWELLDN